MENLLSPLEAAGTVCYLLPSFNSLLSPAANWAPPASALASSLFPHALLAPHWQKSLVWTWVMAPAPQGRMGSIYWQEVWLTHDTISRPFTVNLLPINNNLVDTASHRLHGTARRRFQLLPKLCDWLGSLVSILLAMGQNLKRRKCTHCSWDEAGKWLRKGSMLWETYMKIMHCNP